MLLAEGPEGADRSENVRELLAAAADWSEEITELPEGEEATLLERFLAEAALRESRSEGPGNGREGITLMTLHTAKGLEWPVVCLAGLEDGLFPLARAEEQEGGMEEERRLCYVGLTRAKDKLYLSFARARRRGREVWACMPSRFLSALPPHVIEERTDQRGLGMDGRAEGRKDGSAGGDASRVPGRQPGELARVETFRPSGPSALHPRRPPRIPPAYVKGERVRHRRFGSGTIQGLMGSGRDLKVAVLFDGEEVGLKQLLVAYAGLERDWESA